MFCYFRDVDVGIPEKLRSSSVGCSKRRVASLNATFFSLNNLNIQILILQKLFIAQNIIKF